MKYSSIEISIDDFATLDEAVNHLEQFGEGAEKIVAIRLVKSVTYTLADNSVLFAGSGAAIMLSADDLAYDGEEPF